MSNSIDMNPRAHHVEVRTKEQRERACCTFVPLEKLSYVSGGARAAFLTHCSCPTFISSAMNDTVRRFYGEVLGHEWLPSNCHYRIGWRQEKRLGLQSPH